MRYHAPVRFPLTQQLLDEADEFALRSACCHCFFFVEPERRCALEWPDRGQSRWPLDAPTSGTAGQPHARPTDVEFCKEFELA